MQEVIKVGQLTKSYGELTAVENISLSVARGMVFGLLWANGAENPPQLNAFWVRKRPTGGLSVF